MGFHTNNEIGNKGENAIFNFLSTYPSTIAIIDVTKTEKKYFGEFAYQD